MDERISIYLDEEGLRELVQSVGLNERQRRLFLGWLARRHGRGGITKVASLAQVSMNTVKAGMEQLNAREDPPEDGRIRKPGGGRKPITAKYRDIDKILEGFLVESLSESAFAKSEPALLWTTMGIRPLARKLGEMGYVISHRTVGNLLDGLGFRMHPAPTIITAYEPRPKRDAQFAFIEQQAGQYLGKGLPVLSISGSSPRSSCPDALDERTAFLNMSLAGNAAELLVESLACWWQRVGTPGFPDARKMLVVCDADVHEPPDADTWLRALARLCESTGLEIQVAHFPSGYSRWAQVAHRTFCGNRESLSAADGPAQNARDTRAATIRTVMELVASPLETGPRKIHVANGPDPASQGPGTPTRASNPNDGEVCEAALPEVVPVGEFGQWNYIVRGFQKT